MYRRELEERYLNNANKAVLFCILCFCFFRVGVELLNSDYRSAMIYTGVSIVGISIILFLQKIRFRNIAFFLPFVMYASYISGSFMADSFKYIFSFYLLSLIACATYFNAKNFLALAVLTQIINLLLCIFVIPGHVTGSVWVHYVLSFGASIMLFILVEFAVGKTHEISNAFASFGALMKVTPNVLILIDGENKIKYLSYSVSKVFNINESESFIGKNFLDLFEEISVRNLFGEVAEKRSFYGDYQKIRIAGQVKTFDVFADKMSDDATSGMFFMFTDVSEIVRLKELAEHDSLMDGLIQIPNRRAFDRQILQEWNRALRDRVNLSFLMIDIDFFKKYNDTYGHRQGDELLKSAGEIFKRNLKRSTDFIARLGGEEFGILLYATNAYQANTIAERIRKSVEDEVISTAAGEQSKFTVSIGICSIVPHAGMEYGFIVEEADKAMYKAKQNGRNQVWAADLA